MLLFFLLFLVMVFVYRGYSLFNLSNPQEYNIILYKHKFFDRSHVPLRAVKVLKIRVHDEVIFTNMDNIRHTVATHYQDVQNSPVLQTHDSYKIHFHSKGHYQFYSSLYPNVPPIMIIVK